MERGAPLQHEVRCLQRNTAVKPDLEIRHAVAVHVAGDHGVGADGPGLQFTGMMRECAATDEAERLVAGRARIGVAGSSCRI
jgi:hypothetical protein